MKNFKIHYCYGGPYKGASKHTRIIEGKNKEDALQNFSRKYRSEEIYSCVEIDELKGFKTHRHESNPKEKELHDKFLEHILSSESIIDLLVFNPANPSQTYAVDTLSDREKQIMLSTIQWLGSPVGQSFLKDCGFKLADR